MSKLDKNKITEFAKSNSRIIMLALVMLANYFLFIKNYSDTINESQHLLLLSYQKIGFGPRAFIGTILEFLGFTVNNPGAVNLLINIVYFAVSVLFFLIAVGIIKKSGEKNDTTFIPVFFCVCPLFLYGFSYNLYGSTSAFLVLFALVCFELIISRKAVWTVPLICIPAILTDHIFAFIYLPAICLLMWYKSRKKNDKLYKNNLIFTAITSIPVLVAVICFSYKSVLPSIYYGNYFKSFASKDYHFFEDLSQNYYGKASIVFYEILWICIAALFIFSFVFLWKKCIENSKRKVFFIICAAQLLLCIPTIIYFRGYRSWMISVLISQAILVFGLISENDKSVVEAVGKLSLSMNKNKYLFAIITFIFVFIISVFLPTFTI